MRPIKPKELYPTVASEKDVPVEDVAILIEEYYKKLRNAMANKQWPKVSNMNIGSWRVHRTGLQRQRDLHEMWANKFESEGKTIIADKIKEEVQAMAMLQNDLYGERMRKAEVYKKKGKDYDPFA